MGCNRGQHKGGIDPQGSSSNFYAQKVFNLSLAVSYKVFFTCSPAGSSLPHAHLMMITGPSRVQPTLRVAPSAPAGLYKLPNDKLIRDCHECTAVVTLFGQQVQPFTIILMILYSHL